MLANLRSAVLPAARAAAITQRVAAEARSYPQRGSFARGGASIVASGADAVSIAAGATHQFSIGIVEPCVLDTLVVSGPPSTMNELTVTSARIDNDVVINDTVPAELFSFDASNSPFWGHRTSKNSTIEVFVKNSGASAAIVSVGFVSAPVAA